MTYQKPVQGMRAFAVMVVVFNHLGIAGFSGGFIGVDVFFVISGYLISGLLIEEHFSRGKISLSEFYYRRIKRILPALFVTVSVTALLGFMILSEERFRLLIDSSLAAIFSVSNFYFWSQVGYFDTEAVSKPLLHTWSLGVEEQFYLVWPILIICLAKLKSRVLIVLGIGLISFVSFSLNPYMLKWGLSDILYSPEGFRSWFENEPSTVFYLMPFRVFEFGIGAVLGVLFFKKNPGMSAALSNLLFLVSAALLSWATFWLDEGSVFPSYNALIVACAAALAIYSSSGSKLAAWALGNKAMVFIGSISYSLYLVHWPIISFYSLLFGSPSAMTTLSLLAAMLVLSWAMYRFVEQPARKSKLLSSGEGEGGILSVLPKAAVVVVAAGLAFALTGMKGIEWRIPESRKILTNPEWRTIEREKYCQGEIRGFPKEIFTCQNDRGSKDSVVVWGDSHALHLIAGLSAIFPKHNIAIAFQNGCIPQSGFDGLVREFSSTKETQRCVERNKEFMQWAMSHPQESLIFLSSAKRKWPQRISEINEVILDDIDSYGHAAFVLGDFIRPGRQIAQCRSVPNFIISDEVLQNICTPNERTVNIEMDYSRKMEGLSEKYIPLYRSQCPDGYCRYSDDQGRATYRDHHHLSPTGSVYEMEQASDLIYQYIGNSDAARSDSLAGTF